MQLAIVPLPSVTHSVAQSEFLGLVPARAGSPASEFGELFDDAANAVREAHEKFILWVSARAGYPVMELGPDIGCPQGRIALVAPGDVSRTIDYFLHERSAIGLGLSAKDVREAYSTLSLTETSATGRETHTATVGLAAYNDGHLAPMAFGLSRLSVTAPKQVQTEFGPYAHSEFATEAAPHAVLVAELAVHGVLPEFKNPAYLLSFGYQTGRLAAEAAGRLDETISPVYGENEVVVDVRLVTNAECRVVAGHGLVEALGEFGFQRYLDSDDRNREAYVRGRFIAMVPRQPVR